MVRRLPLTAVLGRLSLVVVLAGGQAVVQLAQEAVKQVAQPCGVAVAGDTALVVVASGF